jgi:hypothetical protein
MLKAINIHEGNFITLTIEGNVYDENGVSVGTLEEAEYPADAVPEGSLTPAEVAWVEKCYPTTTVRFSAGAEPYVAPAASRQGRSLQDNHTQEEEVT